jgi:hypothetical protein
VGLLDAAQSAAGAGRTNDNEDEGVDCPYLGNTITDESVEDVPTIDVPKGRILTFIREVLVKYLLDEVPTSSVTVDNGLDQGDIRSIIRTRFDDLLSQFFGNDEQVCKCRDWNPWTANKLNCGISCPETVRNLCITILLRELSPLFRSQRRKRVVTQFLTSTANNGAFASQQQS